MGIPTNQFDSHLTPDALDQSQAETPKTGLIDLNKVEHYALIWARHPLEEL